MPTNRHDFTIEAGTTFDVVVTYVGPNGTTIDLSGYTARMIIAPSLASGVQPYFNLTSDPSGGLTLGGVAGTIHVNIPKEQTASVITAEALGRYKLEITAGTGQRTRLLEGIAILKL